MFLRFCFESPTLYKTPSFCGPRHMFDGADLGRDPKKNPNTMNGEIGLELRSKFNPGVRFDFTLYGQSGVGTKSLLRRFPFYYREGK